MSQKLNILMTSVIGPYGVDTSRTRYKNPMSLLSNQVTRGQKYYTVQMTQRTFAFDLLGCNLNADVSILDFPRRKQLLKILSQKKWDRIGISSIPANFESLLATYQCIRKVLPNTPIDIGGHIANDEGVIRQWIDRVRKKYQNEKFRVWIPNFEKNLRKNESDLNSKLQEEGIFGDSLTFVKRDGLEYYRQLPGVGLKNSEVIYAPLVDASFGKRVLGIPVPGTSAGLMIPDVGCPMRCDFCATSHKFGGRFLQFLKSAEDLMAVANAHSERGKDEFFVMSENFSLDTERAKKLLKLMEREKKPYQFSVFSSANGLRKLGIENIVKLGYTFVWIGLEESTGTTYKKMWGTDLKDLVRELQEHGVEVLGSTILGFEHQGPGDIHREINHALSYECVYNQFMLYTPVPGTPFYEKMKNEKKLVEVPWPDFHGQSIQNWKHPRLKPRNLEALLDRAFELDFIRLGPSLIRMMKVQYSGYCKTRFWDHDLVQMRRRKLKKMFGIYIAFLDAMISDLRILEHAIVPEARALQRKLIQEIGWKGWIYSTLFGKGVRVAFQIEKLRYFLGLWTRRAPNPRTQFTSYGLKWKPRLGWRVQKNAEPSMIPIPRAHFFKPLSSHSALEL